MSKSMQFENAIFHSVQCDNLACCRRVGESTNLVYLQKAYIENIEERLLAGKKPRHDREDDDLERAPHVLRLDRLLKNHRYYHRANWRQEGEAGEP